MMGPLSFPLLICIALALSQASSEATQCKENYQQFEDSCYFLSDVADTWSGGQRECASRGGNLVSIQTDKENIFTRGLTSNSAVWIGGFQYELTNSESLKWRWVDGQRMTYTNWDRGQPRDFPKKSVVMMFADGTWGNEYPTQTFKYICEEHPLPSCDEGWLLDDNNCYIYREEKLGFREAQTNCSADHGNLASVHSHETNGVLKSLTGDDYAWIGGYRTSSSNDDWRWTDLTPFDFQQWATSQPAENPNNNCILMNYPDKDKVTETGWSNELCDIAYGYICQKPQKHYKIE